MKIPKFISDHAKKIGLGILAAAITSVLGYFGYEKIGDNTSEKEPTKITNSQNIDGNSDCNTQISDGSGNTVNSNCSTSNTNNIENQENNREKTEIDQVDQLIKNGGDGGNTFCAGNDDTACSNDGTIYNNPAQ